MDFLKKDNWRFSFAQRIGIFIVLLALVAIELVFNVTSNISKLSYEQNDLKKITALEEELSTLIVNYELNNYSSSNYAEKFIGLKDSIKPFNPNDLTKQGWEKLGFTAKQAEVIVKYKEILGGKFESKEQIKKCYVISDEIYAVLEPKILLPNKSKADEKLVKTQLSKKVNYSKFNPNHLTKEGWEKLGFSDRQAESILKYKNILGGEFSNKVQIKKCFVISEEKFLEMEPFIDLPDKAEKNFIKENNENQSMIPDQEPIKVVKKIVIEGKFNPNNLSAEQWVKLGFSEKQANTILNFKKSLGGKFKDAKTLKKCYAISEEKFTEIEPYLIFE